MPFKLCVCVMTNGPIEIPQRASLYEMKKTLKDINVHSSWWFFFSYRFRNRVLSWWYLLKNTPAIQRGDSDPPLSVPHFFLREEMSEAARKMITRVEKWEVNAGCTVGKSQKPHGNWSHSEGRRGRLRHPGQEMYAPMLHVACFLTFAVNFEIKQVYLTTFFWQAVKENLIILWARCKISVLTVAFP